MDNLNICKPRGNPSKKLEDENNTSRLEMKEHICMSMLETQIACRRWWMGQKKEKEAIFCSSWPPRAKCCRSMASSRMVEIQNSVSSESKIEIEGAVHLSNRSTVTEENIVPKEKNRADSNVNRAANCSIITDKISTTMKTCSIPVLDSSSVFCNSSGADAGGEERVDKIKSTSSRDVISKVSRMSSGRSASKMSYLVDQRSLSIACTSRADFVPTALKNGKLQRLSQGPSSSGVGARPNNVEARGQMFSANLMVSPAMEKVENSPAKDPLQGVRCSSDKFKSKSGCRPSKRQMIQKSSIHPRKVVKRGFPAFAGELEEDCEELLFSVDFAREASDRACSNSFWKKMEPYFTSVTSQDESYLKHQLDLADALSGISYQISGDENDNSDDPKLRQHPIYSGGRQSPADQELIGTKNTPVEAPLHQRLIAAIIEDDESKYMSLHGEGINDFQCASDDFYSADENRDKMAFKNINCEAKGVVDRISVNDIGSVEDKLEVELQNLDICPEMHAIDKDIIELECGLVQQAQKKLKYIRKIYDSVQQGKHAEERKLEQAAMSSKLIEMAYRKQRDSSRTALDSPRTALRRVSNQVALPFAERTLTKCREFDNTGRSCFREGALKNIVFSTSKSNSFPNSVGEHTSRSSNSMQPKSSGSRNKQQYMGMNRDSLLNDVCCDPSRAMPGSAKEKPSSSFADARESIPKPEVKASNSLASGAEPGSRYMEPKDAASDSPSMQDQDWQGLDIPMDDLADVHFLSWVSP
ncbi:hypothetical protein POM88_044496 [Heracleum sosnowskyi]|uniref:Uncharacterized protein n=1 Tax=Heracleum sosnowskyi TaxID=360622 RepID=A0AAD8H2X2_9APIA|nr:hypothetical protein POM88_044496 [Heracleum sosnowskyi]